MSARVLLLTGLLGLASVAAHAQEGPEVVAAPLGDPSADDLTRARGQFAEGTAAAEQGRWSDALGAFREAYELSGIPAALYNVGTTYRSLGRYVEARDAFTQLLRDHPQLPEATRAQAEELRAEVAARIAVLELRGVPTAAEAPNLDLRLDGRVVAVPERRPVDLETEGGSHTVRITRPGHEVFVWEGPLAEGDRRVVEVSLVARPIAEVAPGGMSRAGKIILFTVLGLVVVGAAVTTALVLTRDGGLDPQSEFVVEL